MKTSLKLFLILLVAIGLVAGAYWYMAHGIARTNNQTESKTSRLSDSTRAVLASLEAPIEIRFYNLLDPATVPDSMRAFAERVNGLLADYEREGDGKIKVVRYESELSSAANAASADGIRAFNIDKGDACYLGIAVGSAQKRESIPQLSQEWEQALEYDLSRAIARVNEAAPAQAAPMPAPSKRDVVAVEQLMHANPALASASLEEGTEMLRTTALDEFKAAATEMQARMKQAELRLAQAQSGNSEPEQKAAAAELQQIRTEQAEKLKEIAARLQTQVAALRQAKASPQ